ncbi:M20/M25/M40 family metallo-hydrolase [Galbibacter mesophilus]|uniref:M20/M25/M40 family metallo-hydrolase n=1 Tax=Galbibacter mesophilus TaxID=379069 RepID=UPI00191E82B5|nr:M20/M25/M40 family metallo-hydrolase [Galbibacter mesophilus]MCM5663147.1 M20/M25/M40 family metallo-hydrolase [Galbibacter mesophilus]
MRIKHTFLLNFLFIVFTAPFIYSQYDTIPKIDSLSAQENSLGKLSDDNIEQYLSKYVQFASVSGHEKEAGEWLKNVCKENGLHITQMGEKDGEYNFTASIYPLLSNLPNIVFLNHIDVVPAGDLSKWEYPPYSGKITDTEIWGRGSWDNKGNAIMQLFSIVEILNRYKGTQLPFNVSFLAVSCEETQCRGGAEYVIANYLDELNPAVVLGEGPPAITGALQTDVDKPIFPISVAHKRALWLKLSLTINTSAHGSVTPLRYANKEMVQALDNLLSKKQKVVYSDLNIKMLKDMGKLEKGLTGFAMRHPKLFRMFITPQLRKQPELFSIFSNTITLTSLESNNDVVNVIPSEATALLDCRLLPGASKEEFIEDIKKRLKNEDIEISVIYSMPKMQSSDDNSIYFKNLKKAIEKTYPDIDVVTISLPNTSDAGVFRAKGILTYTTVPIVLDMSYLDNIHSENERIPRGIMVKGKETYTNFIEECINGDDDSGKKKKFLIFNTKKD